MKTIRNIAIIAHVDHGKTTMIDQLLKQSGTIHQHKELAERAMDSNDLERERGITIYAKCTGIQWKDATINIIDTPGHADFGGEVERVLKMVDSVLLLVDAFEGPMPQTKFVLRKSLELDLQPVVIINKIDRPNARPDQVLDMIFDLFVELDASHQQLDFPVIYASGKEGFAKREIEDESDDLTPLYEAIIEHVPPPKGEADKPLQMQIATLNYDNFLGRVGIGRVYQGSLKVNDTIYVYRGEERKLKARITKLWSFHGLERIECTEVSAGDICAVTGIEGVLPGDTLTDLDDPHPLPVIQIDEPTLSMIFMVNNSPFAGREGTYLTSRQIRDRLDVELERNVALRVEETDRAEAFKVSGRGELHLSVLIEQMRREGYELQVSQPRVIFREIDGKIHEPIENAVIDLDEAYSGTVIQKLQLRRGILRHMSINSDGTQRIEMSLPSRGLIGYRSEFLTDTRGTGVLYSIFEGYEPHRGEIDHRRGGALVAIEKGVTTTYSLHGLQDRGVLFVGAGEEVYGGQVIGEHSRDNELVVNPTKKKALTNVRASGSDDALVLTPHRQFDLEKAIEWIQDDEFVEVTPESVRIRKAELNHSFRKKKS